MYGNKATTEATQALQPLSSLVYLCIASVCRGIVKAVHGDNRVNDSTARQEVEL